MTLQEKEKLIQIFIDDLMKEVEAIIRSKQLVRGNYDR